MVSLNGAVRRRAIIAALAERGKAGVVELAENLGVSVVTIREDLRDLEEEGRLVRTRGGALAVEDEARSELPLEMTAKTNADAKRVIGAAAAAMVRDGLTIIIDVGSTTTALAEALPRTLRDVTVITNAINIALVLENHPGCAVVVTGGTLRPSQHSLVAPFGTTLLERLNADIAFLGCNGVDAARGVTNSNLAEAEIKRAMIVSAAKVVVLADHTKLGRVAAARITDTSRIDLLITDDGAAPDQIAALRDAGPEIRVAGAEGAWS